MFDSLNLIADASINTFSFIIALSIIVFIHEYGHYIVGRWCGIKAEIFSIGFGPVIFSRIDKFGTKWQIAALPLGGYVKFIKDDESLNFDKKNSRDVFFQARSFDTAPLMARTLTVLAGPIANFILSFLILISFLLINGIPSNKVILSDVKDHPFIVDPLLPNDEIISINGYKTPTLNSFYALVKNEDLKETVRYIIKRDGLIKEMSGPNPFPALIENVTLRSSAFNAGLKTGDVIQEINGFKIYKFSQLQYLVASIENYPIKLKVWRGGEIFDFLVTPKLVDYPKQGGGFEKRKLIGISAGSLFEFERTRINFFEATWLSIQQIYGIITGSLDGIKNIIIGSISTCNLQGPIGIASTAGDAAQQGIGTFLRIIAVLSTAIGMLNLFPIPMLDGGHLLFYTYEGIFRKAPSEKIIKFLTLIGIFLLISLMIVAVSSDLFCP